MTVIAITSHTSPETCPLFQHRPTSNCILLPAPIPISETVTFGLPAPTTSTTAALALSDALALAIARRLHATPADVFHRYHPGGAIGANVANAGPKRMADIAIHVAEVPVARKRTHPATSTCLTVLDIILTAAQSPTGWVRLSSTAIISPRRIQALGKDPTHLNSPIHLVVEGNVVGKTDWISIPSGSTVEEARQWIVNMRLQERGKTFLKPGTILGIVDSNKEVSGVVEIEDVWSDDT